uniref:Uncharacterized protein n=1 Tax=Anopheles atroparvus TaxID=41427 RepID=A0AAG5CNV0_ANOAO
MLALSIEKRFNLFKLVSSCLVYIVCVFFILLHGPESVPALSRCQTFSGTPSPRTLIEPACKFFNAFVITVARKFIRSAFCALVRVYFTLTIKIKCPICRKTCRTTLINTELPSTIKEYLTNQAEQMAKAGKIYQFQTNKMDKFIEANLNVFQEYETNKKKIQKLKLMYEAYKKGIKDEQELIHHLQQKQATGIVGCSDIEQKVNSTETPNLIREDFFSKQ